MQHCYHHGGEGKSIPISDRFEPAWCELYQVDDQRLQGDDVRGVDEIRSRQSLFDGRFQTLQPCILALAEAGLSLRWGHAGHRGETDAEHKSLHASIQRLKIVFGFDEFPAERRHVQNFRHRIDVGHVYMPVFEEFAARGILIWSAHLWIESKYEFGIV